ncbi:hypothetical protein [Caballeronia sp. Lep1P3]|uniref:hypothetical protein n=1 Tax=Caballeronia sp. Lep1P3 TaxID=2878150 RepID=UPI001FD50114|nr:hypothetical protein [Caballeronia sp. Lep1P3]
MRGRVKLRSDPLIEYLNFCQAIAEAVCPTGENGLEGIECVTGKIVTRHVPIPESGGIASGPFRHCWQSVLISEDGRTLNELLPSDLPHPVENGVLELPLPDASPRQVGELTLPFKLSDADRRELAKVLTKLPPLRYPMAEEATAAFMEAYFNLSDRPMWVPDLVSAATINRRKAEQATALERHQKALKRAFEAGWLVPVNAYRAPVAILTAGTLIPRAQAIVYLEQHGLEYDVESSGGINPDVGAAGDDVSPKPATPESSRNALTSPGWTGKVSPSERAAAAVQVYRDLKQAGERNYTMQTALRFGVSKRSISKWVKEAKEREKQQKTERLPASFFPTSQ